MTAGPTPEELALGSVVFDIFTEQYGTVVDITLGPNWVDLRPLGGGREWTARRDHLRPAAPDHGNGTDGGR